MPDKTERLEVRLPAELKELLDRQAEKEFTSRSEIVRRALLQYLAQYNASPFDLQKAENTTPPDK